MNAAALDRWRARATRCPSHGFVSSTYMVANPQCELADGHAGPHTFMAAWGPMRW